MCRSGAVAPGPLPPARAPGSTPRARRARPPPSRPDRCTRCRADPAGRAASGPGTPARCRARRSGPAARRGCRPAGQAAPGPLRSPRAAWRTPVRRTRRPGPGPMWLNARTSEHLLPVVPAGPQRQQFLGELAQGVGTGRGHAAVLRERLVAGRVDRRRPRDEHPRIELAGGEARRAGCGCRRRSPRGSPRCWPMTSRRGRRRRGDRPRRGVRRPGPRARPPGRRVPRWPTRRPRATTPGRGGTSRRPASAPPRVHRGSRLLAQQVRQQVPPHEAVAAGDEDSSGHDRSSALPARVARCRTPRRRSRRCRCRPA